MWKDQSLHLALAAILLSPLLFIGRFPRLFPGIRWVPLRECKLGLLLIASYVVISILIFSLLTNDNQPQFWSIPGVLNSYSISYLMVFCGLVPLTEEIFFRSFVYGLQNLSTNVCFEKAEFFQKLKLIYTNALIFWLFHIPADWSIILESLQSGSFPLPLGPFFLGVVCATLAMKEGTLIWAILLHALANASAPFWGEALTRLGVFHWFYF